MKTDAVKTMLELQAFSSWHGYYQSLQQGDGISILFTKWEDALVTHGPSHIGKFTLLDGDVALSYVRPVLHAVVNNNCGYLISLRLPKQILSCTKRRYLHAEPVSCGASWKRSAQLFKAKNTYNQTFSSACCL